MNEHYKDNGYCVVRQLFNAEELNNIKTIVEKFHQSWKQKHSEFYHHNAINSAYLTGTEHLNQSDRNTLFKFIGSNKMMARVRDIIAHQPSFMNTQLFFNPYHAEQNNYWHRDMQYHLSIPQQKAALNDSEVVHFRIPLNDEPGIELIPGTHKRWDSEQELDIRLENDGHKNHEPIDGAVTIALQAGDLLMFSANMIHRGLYGMNRLALDVIFCDPDPTLLEFVELDCLPSPPIITDIDDPAAFISTQQLLQSLK